MFKINKLNETDFDLFKNELKQSFQDRYGKYSQKSEIFLSDKDIDNILTSHNSVVYAIYIDNILTGGAIVAINEKTNYNHLYYLYVKVGSQNKGIGYKIWNEIEKLYPNTKIWETVIPCFDKINIHFYINKCNFYIVEYYNKFNPNPIMGQDDEMFRLKKIMY